MRDSFRPCAASLLPNSLKSCGSYLFRLFLLCLPLKYDRNKKIANYLKEPKLSSQISQVAEPIKAAVWVSDERPGDGRGEKDDHVVRVRNLHETGRLNELAADQLRLEEKYLQT